MPSYRPEKIGKISSRHRRRVPLRLSGIFSTRQTFRRHEGILRLQCPQSGPLLACLPVTQVALDESDRGSFWGTVRAKTERCRVPSSKPFPNSWVNPSSVGPSATSDRLACLEEILAMDDERCQAYALHGLNHLDHPQRPTVVQRWIEAHRNRGWNMVWVEKCRDGTAM